MDSIPLDRRALRRLFCVIGGDPDDLRDLIGDFRDSVPELVTAIREAAQTGDADALRRGAHTLKSNARDFGATTLADLAADLERNGAAAADGAVQALDAACARALAALAALDPDDLREGGAAGE
ncbi:MAG: Hpt domain-containing protein [Alphaproteobacteria bacterium]|nr:Hpt domain-containing protein [Alphaproteobacteria bacterium]